MRKLVYVENEWECPHVEKKNQKEQTGDEKSISMTCIDGIPTNK